MLFLLFQLDETQCTVQIQCERSRLAGKVVVVLLLFILCLALCSSWPLFQCSWACRTFMHKKSRTPLTTDLGHSSSPYTPFPVWSLFSNEHNRLSIGLFGMSFSFFSFYFGSSFLLLTLFCRPSLLCTKDCRSHNDQCTDWPKLD